MRQIFIKNMTCATIGVDELCCWCHVSAIDGRAIHLELELTWEVRGHTENWCRTFIMTVNALNNMPI